jgi:hypothetical protein
MSNPKLVKKNSELCKKQRKSGKRRTSTQPRQPTSQDKHYKCCLCHEEDKPSEFKSHLEGVHCVSPDILENNPALIESLFLLDVGADNATLWPRSRDYKKKVRTISTGKVMAG